MLFSESITVSGFYCIRDPTPLVTKYAIRNFAANGCLKYASRMKRSHTVPLAPFYDFRPRYAMAYLGQVWDSTGINSKYASNYLNSVLFPVIVLRFVRS